MANEKDKLNITIVFLDSSGVDVNTISEQGDTPFKRAIDYTYIAYISILLSFSSCCSYINMLF